VICVREGEGTGRKDTKGVGRTAWRGCMARRAPRDSADLMPFLAVLPVLP